MFPAASAAGPPPLFQNVLPEPSSRNELVGAPFGSMLRTEARLRSFALKPMIQPV
jgi:hypothetical protein